MNLREIIEKTFEEGMVRLRGVGTFRRRDVIHGKSIGGNTTKPYSTITFELSKKLRR